MKFCTHINVLWNYVFQDMPKQSISSTQYYQTKDSELIDCTKNTEFFCLAEIKILYLTIYFTVWQRQYSILTQFIFTRLTS